MAWLVTKQEGYAFIISISTALVGWNNSNILSNLNFIRSETSKNRDSVAQYVDKLFDEMEALFTDRSLKRDKLETILSSRVSILELRLNHIQGRTKMTLLSTEQITALRNNPLDLLDSQEYKTHLLSMRFEYLEAIEQNYSDWIKNKI